MQQASFKPACLAHQLTVQRHQFPFDPRLKPISRNLTTGYFLFQEVICTSRDGDHFWKMPECYIRGSTIKYLRIPDEIIDMVKEENLSRGRGRGRGAGRGGRGGFGGRGRGGQTPGGGRGGGQQAKRPRRAQD